MKTAANGKQEPCAKKKLMKNTNEEKQTPANASQLIVTIRQISPRFPDFRGDYNGTFRLFTNAYDAQQQKECS